MDVLAAHLTDTPPSMSTLRDELPPGLDEVVRRGLAKTRETRYEAAAELRDELDAVFAGRWAPPPDTVVIPPAALVAVATSAAPGPRRGWWLATLAMLVLTAGAWGFRHWRTVGVTSAAQAPRPEPAPPAPAPLALPEKPPRTRTAPAIETAPTPSPRAAPMRQRRRTIPALPAGAVAAPVPPNSASLVDEGERLIAEGRGKEACARGEEALRLEPSAPTALRFLARCYMRTGRRAAALASYRRYLEVAPDAADAPLIRSIVQ